MRRLITRSARGRGFTLVEAAVATVLIGMGIVALLAAFSAGTNSTEAGRKITQAVFLAQEIREWTLRLPFSDPDLADANNPPGPDGSSPQVFVDDLDDLLNVTYSPPRNGQGSAISDMTAWSETIQLTWRNPADLNQVVANGSSNFIYVDLSISCRGKPVLQTGWLVARR